MYICIYYLNKKETKNSNNEGVLIVYISGVYLKCAVVVRVVDDENDL